MNRETKMITTPGGNQIELKTYITGREERELQQVYLSKMTDISGDQKPAVTSETIIQAQNKAWEMVIVSINGHKNGDNVKDGDTAVVFSIVEAILDMPNSETAFIKQAVDEVTNPLKKNQTT